jgi:hypothetical protein
MAKRATSDQKTGNDGNGATKGKGKKPRRSFPIVSLEEALKIPQAVKAKNNGHPWESELTAKACGMPRNSVKFFYLSAAARDYGLSVGTRDTPIIELTDLGREIVYADDPALERAKKIEAFFRVEKFKQVYDHYNGSKLPEAQYLSNALDNKFQIPPAQHAEFTEVFKANCQYLGIEEGIKGTAASNGATKSKAIEFRALGQPEGDFDKLAFVIMPFSEKGKPERSKGFFDEVLNSLITPAANNAGFAVQTARREDSDIIHHTIINQLLNADLVIADLTDHNPNVLCELGIRLAKNKSVVIIKSKDTGPVFDVDNLMRVYMYDQNLWISTVQADVKGLTERISGTWEKRETSATYMQILTAGPQAVKA